MTLTAPCLHSFQNTLTKYPYEGHMHLRQQGRKKPCVSKIETILSGPIGHTIKYLWTKLDRAGWENIWL